MNNPSSTNVLVSRKATEADWDSILKLLEETKLSFWFTGEENYKNFFVVINGQTNEIVNCFAIYIEGKVGILKQFATSKTLQGKGIGKYIANEIIPKTGKELGLEEIYLQGGNKEPFTSMSFWEKTIFKHIDKDEIKNDFAKNYITNLEKNLPEDFFREATFYIEV
jgi:N-acetylglutamate synthase-like GNAT family acetyltransferase